MDFTMPDFAPQLANEPFALDLQALAHHLDAVPDWRDPRGVRYPLSLLLLLVVLAKLAGYSHPRAIAEWAHLRRAELARFFGLTRATMPHPTTWTRVLGTALTPGDLEAALQAFFRPHLPAPTPDGLLQMSIDGKTLCGTIPAGASQGVHLLAVYLPGLGFALTQAAVSRKANEITVAPRILTGLPLAGTVVSGDAMFTQRALSVQILAAGGDYLWTVKTNQRQLHEDIALAFAPLRADERATDYDYRTAQTLSKGHGRLEERTIRVSSMLAGDTDWPGAAQVFAITSVVTRPTGRVTRTVRYGVTSLSAAAASPAQLLGVVRQHWGQEAGLHYRRDVTLGEDRGQTRRGGAPQVLAALNNAVVGLVGLAGATNLAAVQRGFAYRLERALLDQTTRG
jgi:predicted transposase YbfD/YdcC